MPYFIKLEDIIPNAFITMMKENNQKQIKTIPIAKIEKYGETVVNIIHQNGNEAILTLSRNDTYYFKHQYAKYFEIIDLGKTDPYVKMIGEHSIEELAKEFCGGIPIDVLDALTSQKAIQVLMSNQK